MNPSKRPEGRKEEIKEETINPPAENGKESANNNGKTEHVCYETKIIGGVVVRTPVRKVEMLGFNSSVHVED